MKRQDPDILALKQSIKALNKSTSRQLLEANLRFLWDRYIAHPAKCLPEHLKPSAGAGGSGTTDPFGA